MNLTKYLKITVLRIIQKYESVMYTLIEKQFVNVFAKTIK